MEENEKHGNEESTKNGWVGEIETSPIRKKKKKKTANENMNKQQKQDKLQRKIPNMMHTKERGLNRSRVL